MILPPITISNERKTVKRPVVTRPLSDEGMKKFEEFFCTHTWGEVLNVEDIDQKVLNFHNTIRAKLDEIFPEKVIMVSYLDKKWMNPQLKNLLRKTKREFFKNRKSKRWKI